MGCLTSREQVPKPWVLPSLKRDDWLAWRKCFRTYMDHNGIPHCKRGEKFFKYIGFLGEELSRRLYFANTAQETKYEVLIFKFDVYFLFSTNGTIMKADNQSFEDYVATLEIIAEKMGAKNIVETVKEKILQDFKSKNSVSQETLFDRLNKMGYGSRISNYENLSMHELSFLWKECDHQQTVPSSNSCKFCSRRHPSGKCYAMGKKCWKCGGTNHFARCCQKTFVTKCAYCGSGHEVKMCPAFTKECSNCKRLNHFSWMCNTEMVDNCVYCGGRHINGRNKCHARHSICKTCSKKGHYTSYCFHQKR